MRQIGTRRVKVWLRMAATAVAGVVLVSVPSGAGVDRAGSPDRLTGGVPVAEAPDAAAAAQAARAQGTRVEAVDLRTETRTVFAEPGGTMTAELASRPVRAIRDGSWVDADTTLVRRPDGSIGPAAAVVDLSFSEGGADRPLVRYGRDGSSIALSWPGTLPVPALSADTATYAEVLPGVDLLLRAEVDGFAQYLVVKNAAAAENPAVQQIRLGLRTDGVELRATAAGGLAARDADGAVVFAAPVSQMWDSSTPPSQAVVGVAVEDGALVLRPDRDLLTGGATRYPVMVDPIWHTADKQAWTSVLSGKPGSSFWNSSGSPPWAQVGRCYEDGTCNGIGVARTYWLFDTSFLAGKFVLEAYFNATVVYSPNCSGRTHQLYKAHAAISSGTTWNNMPGGTHLGNFVAQEVNAGWGCPGNKTAALAVPGAVNRGGSTTFFVKAADENDQLAWRKYDNNAQLRVRFNTAPSLPTGLSTDPPVPAPCKWCGGVPYLGDGGVRVNARLSDPDGDQVRPLWHFNLGGSVSQPAGTFKPSGNFHDRHVDLTNRHGQVVHWAVKGEDGAHGSDWATGVGFVVDRQPPGVKPNVAGELYQQDNRWHGGVGVPGTFRFDSAGVQDIDHFLYGWTDPPATKVNADALGGKASVILTPPGDGPRDLYVQSVDRAGHRSPAQIYHFYVRAGSGPLAQWSFEGNADDEAFLGDRDGTPAGASTYGPGAVGSAVQFEYGGHVAALNTVRTDTSFSVSAWVRLDEVVGSHTAVSQSGQLTSGFRLGYRSDLGERWTFGLTRGDGVGATADVAASTQPGAVRTWTHLTGVYDAPAGQIRLYVNGVLSGTAAHTSRWNATGLTRIGNAQSGDGIQNNHWLGAVDEVKLYDRVLADPEVRAAVGADDVQVGHWKFDELDGTTGRNDVDGGDMVALHNGASFTGDSDGDGLADGGAVGGAVRLDGADDAVTTGGPVVRTDRSFSVAGWVKLDQPPAAPHTVTALSQDGDHISGFFLGYRQLETAGFWELYTPSADAADRPSDAAVRSSLPAQVGVWTHLAAVYDAAAGQLRLYVNGELSGTAARTSGFDAPGPLVIGRGYHGGPSGFWPGQVDEIRAYSRELSGAEVRAVVSRDDVALGEWRLDGNADDATGNGRDGALTGAPDWTGGQTAVPDPTDLAVRLDGGGHISLPHIVDVRQSFSVAAWAKLDRVGGTATVVSQDGDRTSSFQLMATPDGRWALAMVGSDTDSAGTVDRLDGPAAQVGVWTHLVGIYDAGAHQLSLYVNGVRSGTAAHTQTWDHPTGGLQIGAALWRGNRQNRVLGAIDDVAVYGRMLFAEEIRVMAGRDLTLAHNWRLDEGSGDQAADAVGRQTATLAGGATRVPGRLGNAVALDGVDDRVATAGVDIRTDAGFTVTAWVNLAETCDPGDEFACQLVAVSQDGGEAAAGASKFRLGHLADRGQNPDGVWVFELPEPDGTVTKAAVTVLPSDFGRWVHLAGVYDEPTGKLWLYVNGTRKGDGTLNDRWHGTGGLQIGRGRDAAGDPAQFFPGRLDDVRLYSGGLDDGRISNLFHSYPEQGGPAELPTADAGHWRFDENAGTAVADSSGRGLTATLQGGADWTAGRIGHAGRFDGVDGYAQTAGPVLDTSRSFSVSAWAYLTREDENRVLVAQDGNQASGFFLFYDAASHRWAAGIPAADAESTTLVAVTSNEPVFVGHWTQLGLVYDAELDQLRLYVNGRLSAAQVGVASWPADGPLTIGRGRGQGTDGAYFPGAVDDVRAYQQALSNGEMGRVYDQTGPVEVGRWRFDDQTLRDSSWRDNPTTAADPVSYVEGVDGMALALDGTAAATTQHWGVSEMGSLTVSAWAKLTHEPAVQTVLAQDGTRRSGFALQYRPSLDRWVFGAWTQDADQAELAYARSGAPATLGEWTHLTGVYDHAAGQLRLYVDGQLAGSRDGVTLWPSTGGLTIGRGQQDGAPAQFFTGGIDEVRIDLGIVPDPEIAARAQP